MTALIAKNLKFRYKGAQKYTLDGLNLTVNKAHIHGFLGANGAGKSTFIKLLVGLNKTESGTLTLFGQPPALNKSVKLKLGYTPQDIALYATLNARENLMFFGSLAGLKGSALKRSVDQALEQVSLTKFQYQRVEEYSGGMKRRINLAISLLHQPIFLALDEPTVGVDPQSRHAIFDILENLRADGVTILYATHYMEEIERLCDQVSIIDQGKVIANGSVAELTNDKMKTVVIELNKLVGDSFLGELENYAEGGNINKQSGNRVSFQKEAHFEIYEFLQSLTKKHELKMTHFELRRYSLEQKFIELTGRGLRDS